MARVAVLMPVFNGSKHLAPAIASILSQTHKEFEFIIVDDGSTDETPGILACFAASDSRVKVLHQSNAGIVAALNAGLAQTTAPLVARMDADDIALEGRLALQVLEMETRPTLLALAGGCEIVDGDDRSLGYRSYPTRCSEIIKAISRGRPAFPHPSVMFRRDAVLRAGGYRERFRHAEDTDLWLRLCEWGELGALKVTVLRLRKHEANISALAGGHPQRLNGLLARVCYFKRRMGHVDPATLSDEAWSAFVQKVEAKLAERDDEVRLVGRLRKARLEGRSVPWDAARLPFRDQMAIVRYLSRRLRGDRLPEGIALESSHWP